MRLTLAVVDWDQPFELEVDLEDDSTSGGVVLSQGKGKHKQIVARVGRELTARELAKTPPEQMLILAAWGMRRLSRWVMFARAGVVVVLPTSECLVLAKDKEVHYRLRAVALELDMYGVSYRV